jgi:vitamin B12 transporter
MSSSLSKLPFSGALACLFPPLFLLPCAHAQSVNSLEPVTITATRTPLTRAQAMADVVIIDRQMIEQSGAQTVAQLLSSFAAVEIAENGGQGKTTGVFLRGTKTAQSLILLNGSKLENASSGGANLEFLPLNAIERIEVVQGPASAVYGSSAIGGVIHIITRSDTPTQVVQASVGSRGTRQLRAATGGAFSQGSWQVQLGTQRTNGFDATLPASKNAQADNDGARQDSASAFANWRVADGFKVGLNAMKSSGSSQYDDSFSTPETARLKFGNSQLGVDLNMKPMQSWESNLRLSRSQINYEFFAFEFSPKAVTRALAWENQYRLNPATSIVFGADSTKQQVKGAGVTYETDTRNNSAYWLGTVGSNASHQWRVQARHDKITSPNSQGLSANHYSAAYGYQFTPTTVLSISTATAFRAPTFDDLFSPFGGNPNLRPEKSKSWEMLLQQRSGATDWSVVLFSQVIRDAIELDADFTPQNQQKATVRGVTAKLLHSESFGTDRLTFRSHLTAQDPTGRSQNGLGLAAVETQLARRARVHGALGLDYQFGPFNAGSQIRAQGKRVDADGSPLAPYAVVDVNANYQLQAGLSAQLKLLNLANRQYETAAGYRSQPRAVSLGLTWRGQ